MLTVSVRCGETVALEIISYKDLKSRFHIVILILACAAQNALAQQSAQEIMDSVIVKKQVNDPRLRYDDYSYESYQNLRVLGDPEALTGPGYKKTELRKTLKKTGVFFAEKTSRRLYSKDEGNKELITAANMPGFDTPVYPIYTIDFQSDDIYDSDYVIFDRRFKSPLRDNTGSYYNFQRTADSTIQGRQVAIVEFMPQDSTRIDVIKGRLYVDTATYAVAGAAFQRDGELEIDATHEFSYDTQLDVWHPISKELFVRKKKTAKELELFGGRLQVGNEDNEGEGTPEDDLYLLLNSRNTDFSKDPITDYGQRGLTIELREEALEQPASYWNQYQAADRLNNTELAAALQLDSIVDDSRITRKLETLDKFKVGYYPVGFFDFDLKYLVKYNDYEALRVGLGGQTNSKLSESFRIGGYGAYGTRDGRFKYMINLGYRINKNMDTWLNVYRRDDITEFAAESFLTDARVYSLFEPRLINIPTFYRYEEYGSSLQQRLLPSVLSEIALSRKRVLQTTDYQFRPGGSAETFQNYVLSELIVAARYSPRSSFMRTPKGYQVIQAGYPIFSGQATKGFENISRSDFSYLKVSGKAYYATDNPNGTQTEFTVEGHYGTGEIPLTHLFHAYPNAPNQPEVMQRFSVAGRRSFETMYFNEFFSDRLLIGQVKHHLKPFDIASFLKPEMVLITRAAWGNLQEQDEHLNVAFNTLEKGYFESGFELNKLLFGFGLSVNYRYGAYHLSNIEDNLAVKFTFYLEL